MKHRAKLKLARQLAGNKKLPTNVGVFTSPAWDARKDAIAGRVKRQEARVKAAIEAKRRKDG